MASSLSRQIFPRVVVSRARFEAITNNVAYRIWQLNEHRRRNRNFLEALGELGFQDFVLHLDPRHAQAENYARDMVFHRHKNADAFADWLQAEKEVMERYEVNG